MPNPVGRRGEEEGRGVVNSSDLGVRQPEMAAVKAGQDGSGEMRCWATVVGSRAVVAGGVSPSASSALGGRGGGGMWRGCQGCERDVVGWRWRW